MVLISVKKFEVKKLGWRILEDVSLEVDFGERLAIYGKGKGGKTLVLLVIANYLKGQGKIKINGRIGTGFIEKVKEPLEELTVYENLEFFSRSVKIRGRYEIEQIMESLDLMKMKNIAVKELGEFAKARLSLGIAMIGKTETILLDEPTRELTNKEKKAFWELLNKVLGKRGLIFTTKDEDELKEARKSVYLHGGKIVR